MRQHRAGDKSAAHPSRDGSPSPPLPPMALSGAGYAAIPNASADNNDQHGHPTTTWTQSPTLPELTHSPLSAAFEDLAGSVYVEEPPSKSKASVSDVLKSLTGSSHSTHSYELVEEDDYEQPQATPTLPKTASRPIDDGRRARGEEDTPVRTASISRNLPLHNPTPDLQAIQGAYVKNVQALEDSAEKISLAGSIDEELQRMKHGLPRTESRSSHAASIPHQRRFSSTSMSNSIIGVNATARAAGFSPAGFVTSPVGSVRSQQRLSQKAARVSRASNMSNPLPEPELEGRPLESAMVHTPPSHAMQPRNSSESQRSISQTSQLDRPGTSASNDTYRQAQNLFTDFDGTHYNPATDEYRASRCISINHPPLARDSKVFTEKQPDQKTVYYPAPVPVMLNLPKRLSQHNWAQQEKRKTKALSVMPQGVRKSAAWLANAEIDAEYDPEPEKARNRMSTLPPQLRASAFFDMPGTKADVQLKDGSAVQTLDSILDAAAHAPVSAFTDHPIAGHLGDEVYGQESAPKKKTPEAKTKRRSSLSNVLGNRKSTMSGTGQGAHSLDDDLEADAERSMAPGEDELDDGEREGSEDDEHDGSDGGNDEQQHKLGFLGAPTTLLAELQMRKAQQKQRNRTAANAFPQGMHSTLLELDAVTQLQQKSRRTKHVALAWEDQDEADKANFDDEDVPLGVLFPEKERQTHVNFNKPLGLMEKREMEENEPLSSRRARLRGEQYQPAPPRPEPSSIHYEPAPAVKLSGVDDEDEDEGETLAQRRKRMQEKNRRLSLADDIATQLGLEPESIGGSKTPEPEPEETLGQRRKRLQAEAEKNGVSLKTKTSMGDLLRANPVRPKNDERQVSAESKVSLLLNRRDPSMPLVDHIQAAQPTSKAMPSAQSNAISHYPHQTLLHHHEQQQRTRYANIPYQVPQSNAMQSMPNLNMPSMNGFQMPQNPYMNMQNSMSQLNFGMPNMNMMYNPMAMNMNMDMGSMQMPMGGLAPQATTATSPYDPIGMGPPLNPQQRANIDRWRQGIA